MQPGAVFLDRNGPSIASDWSSVEQTTEKTRSCSCNACSTESPDHCSSQDAIYNNNLCLSVGLSVCTPVCTHRLASTKLPSSDRPRAHPLANRPRAAGSKETQAHASYPRASIADPVRPIPRLESCWKPQSSNRSSRLLCLAWPPRTKPQGLQLPGQATQDLPSSD